MDNIFSFSVATIVTTIIIILVILVLVVWLSVRAHQRQIAVGKEDLVGQTAVVNVTLEPRGVVLIEGERWTAISDSGNIEPENEVIVTRVEGLKLYVTKK
ncbi:NfeD family protein [Chloroflexota bacterium]